MSVSRAYVLALMLVITTMIALAVTSRHALDILRNFVFDSMQRAAPFQAEADGPVRIIDVDEASLSRHGQWPWPRTVLATLTEKLAEAGAVAIVYDIVFAEADRTSPETMLQVVPDVELRNRLADELSNYLPHDLRFARSIAATRVVLGATLTQTLLSQPPEAKSGFAHVGDSPDQFLPTFAGGAFPIAVLLDQAQGLGATNWLPDQDQVIRSVPLLLRTPKGILPSLALEALRVAQGADTIVVRSSNASGEYAFGTKSGVNAVRVGALDLATGTHGEVRVRFSYSQPSRYIPAHQVLDGKIDKAQIEGRIILIGASAIGLADIRATPLEAAVPGVEVHAQILEHLISGRNFVRPDWMQGIEWGLAVLLAIALWAILPMTSVVIGAAVGFLAAGTLAATASWLYVHRGLHFDPVFPSLAGLASYLLSSATLWQTERSNRRQLRMAFGKFLAPAVIDQLAENPERLVLGGETRELTIMFSDLRDFTSLSEGMDAQQLTRFMNDYLSPMTDIIIEQNGTVDKYIGDAIVAFWNAPLDDAEHGLHAVNAALGMRDALAAFNKARFTDDQRQAHFGLGLNLGPCSVGNMGSVRRFDYSALGDNVNLASRIEGLTKAYGIDILATKAVVDSVSTHAWLHLDDVRVKGKSKITALYALCGSEAFAKSDEFALWSLKHAAMMRHYCVAEFDEALPLAQQLQRELPQAWQDLYRRYGERFVRLAAEKRHDIFDPVINFDAK